MAEIVEEELDNGQKVQFDALWSSSLTDSTVRGRPDTEAVDLSSRLITINEIFSISTKPLIFDGDTGGKLEHFPYMIKTLERTGVSAVIIEDKVGSKRNSLFGDSAGQTQDSIEGFCIKIAEGKKAQISQEFMIIARIESLVLSKGMEDALERAGHYVDAGADGIMIHSASDSPDEVLEFCKAFRADQPDVPLVAVPSNYNTITDSELADAGVNVVIHANHLLRAAYPAMVQAAKLILQNDRSWETKETCMPIKEILTLIPEI